MVDVYFIYFLIWIVVTDLLHNCNVTKGSLMIL